MAIDPVVVERYAEAVFERALKEGVLTQLAEEANTLLPPLAQIGELRKFMESPRIPVEEKRALIERTFAVTEASQLDELALLLLDKGRIEHFRPIVERFLVLEEEHRGFFNATVTTAYGLGAEERDRLERLLAQHTGHQLDLTFEVDPAIIGGVVFRHRDDMIDTSLRSGLSGIREQLASVRVH